MMLSPQAARMGTVYTTLRKIGMSRLSQFCGPGKNDFSLRQLVSSKAISPCVAPEARCFSSSSTSDSSRHQSTLASTSAEDDDVEEDISFNKKTIVVDRSLGHSAAAEARASGVAAAASGSDNNAWKINLGRMSNGDAWLHGPRSEDWFTGRHPYNDCPGMSSIDQAMRSLPLPNLSAVTRQIALEYFDNSWTLFETLFAGLKGEEGFYRPPVHGLRHPQIFYYGHTACLYINKLRVSGVLKAPANAYFESIFEMGVDEMLWDDMHKNEMLWPTVSEVHEYRKEVYQTVVDAIMTHSSLDESNGPVRVDQKHPMWALFMGFEHERIHLETSSVLFREMPNHLVQKPKHWPPLHPSAHQRQSRSITCNPKQGVDFPRNRMIHVHPPQGASLSVDLGKPADFPSFGWDNEYGERRVSVPPFSASEYMVTNGEFYQFVRDGGYRTREYWCDDGWAWRKHRNMKWPFFWEPAGPAGSHEYTLRAIFEIISMPWDWPVDVNYYEAMAFCRWKTAKEGSPASNPYRILTEAEHHVIRHRAHNLDAARKDVSADKVMVTSGEQFPEGPTGSNINLAYSSQNPVDYFAPSQTGHRDTTGSAWEWCADTFNPLKGFEVHHVYDDFSTPCFDGKHSMIVGGSFISTGDEASVFARFHFRPHFLQHSGFRLVASNEDAPATHMYAGNFEGQAAARDGTASATTSSLETQQESNDDVYETEASLHMYLGLHYPTSGEAEGVAPILPHENAPIHGVRFPQRVAQLLVSLKPETTNNHALDVGCAVGGASFQLAKTFNRVDAFDFSQSFVDAAKRMQDGNDIQFTIPVEAELKEQVRAVHEEGVTSEIRAKVKFFTGDACQMAEMAADGQLGSYDGVVMSNLLCRLPNPMACLNSLPAIVNTRGVVVMVTPFSWLTEFTPRSKWLGGFYDPVSKEPIRSKEVLQRIMESNGFEKVHEEEMPLVIREHQRKYQYIVSEATGWRKTE